MNFSEAVRLMLGAFELRYWAVFAALVMVAAWFGLVSESALVVACCAYGLGGWLAGVRMCRDGSF